MFPFNTILDNYISQSYITILLSLTIIFDLLGDQNKVHHLMAILYLVFNINITQVSYVIHCIIPNEVQLNSFYVWKLHQIWKNLKSDKPISNHPATAQFEIFLTQKLFVISFCNHKMGIINMHFWWKPFLIYLNTTSFISNRAVRDPAAHFEILDQWYQNWTFTQ